MLTKSEIGLDSAAAVGSLSQQKQEPIWFTDLRHRAWRFFEEIPWPTGEEEEWRRTRLTGLDIAKFKLAATADDMRGDVADLTPALREELESINAAAALVTEDGAVRYHGIDNELTAKGVIFTDLDTAIRQHPELIQKHFMTDNVAVDVNKFTALHAAPVTGGRCSTCRAMCRSNCHFMASPRSAAVWQTLRTRSSSPKKTARSPTSMT
ncbi:MAG: hypothetical protein H6647_02010 [Anaerolineales bacterium]|nr:hypothetical protein [Anaerolineales bacterium]